MVPAEDLSSGSGTLLTTAVTPASWRPPQVLCSHAQLHTYPNTHMHIQITENKNVSFFIRRKEKIARFFSYQQTSNSAISFPDSTSSKSYDRV